MKKGQRNKHRASHKVSSLPAAQNRHCTDQREEETNRLRASSSEVASVEAPKAGYQKPLSHGHFKGDWLAVRAQTRGLWEVGKTQILHRETAKVAFRLHTLKQL